MSHKPNRTNLPPAKSAEEYERELAAIRARIEEFEMFGLRGEFSALLDVDPASTVSVPIQPVPSSGDGSTHSS